MENNKMTAAVTGILTMLILNSVQCTLIMKPSDAAAKIGEVVFMRCSSSHVNDTCGSITWSYFKPNSTTGGIYINHGDKVTPSVNNHISLIDSSEGNCHLRITATPLAAGRYACIGDGVANAVLIVLENVPEIKPINESRSNTVTALECSVHYYGNWASRVQWQKIAGDSWKNVTGVERVIIKDADLSLIQFSSLIQIPAGSPAKHFTCNLTITEHGKTEKHIYAWKSLECGAAWNTTEVEGPAYNDGLGRGIGIGFVIGFVICLCLLGVILILRTSFSKKPNESGLINEKEAEKSEEGL